MMRALGLSRHRRARVWLGELPNAEYLPTDFIRRVVSVGSASPPAGRVAAIELMVPHGPNASYGLLGAELLESGRIDGELSVAVSGTGLPMLESLAAMPDDVRIGLPNEYANAVVSGVERVVNAGWRFEGELTFRWAAHAAVGSSSAFFAELAALVAGLLAKRSPPSEDELYAMFS